MAHLSPRQTADPAVEGLSAASPDPALADKLMLFGQFVGDWDIVEARYPQPDGSSVTRTGEIHFGWILEGRAVQDVWMGTDPETGKVRPAGSTVRFYDPAIDAWHSIWIAPRFGVVQSFVGRKVKDEIVLESKNAKGHLENWIFSEIARDAFRWRAEESRDEGKTWALTEEMRVARRPQRSP